MNIYLVSVKFHETEDDEHWRKTGHRRDHHLGQMEYGVDFRNALSVMGDWCVVKKTKLSNVWVIESEAVKGKIEHELDKMVSRMRGAVTVETVELVSEMKKVNIEV